jgi:hypothetical protein
MGAKPDQRLSDAERDAVVVQLREGLGDGRLDLEDFRSRLDAAYAAKTHGEIVALTSDLPPVPKRIRNEAKSRRRFNRQVRSYVGVNFILWGVWSAQELTGSSPPHLWPMWVTLPWGAWLIWRAVNLTTTRRRGERRLSA